MANNEPTFPTKTIAKLLDLTEARVGQLWKDGVISKPLERGQYPAGVIPEYIKWLRNKAFGSDISAGDTNKERARLLKHQADEKEMIVAEMRAHLIPKDQVDHAWAEITGAMRAKMLALPGKCAHAAVTAKDYKEANVILRKAVDEALTELNIDILQCVKPDDNGVGTTGAPAP